MINLCSTAMLCQVVEESESESEAFVECRFRRCGQCALWFAVAGHSGPQVKELPDPDWVNGVVVQCRVFESHFLGQLCCQESVANGSPNKNALLLTVIIEPIF